MLAAIILRKRLRKEDSLAIIIGLVIWALLAFFQFSFRGYQVSGVAMMLMALILFLAMENPKEYYEKNIDGVKNRDAFSYMLVEKFSNKKPFFIISVIFTGKSNVISGAERRELYGLEAEFARLAEQNTAEPAYLSEWNTLSFFTNTPEKVEQFMSLVGNYRDDRGNYKLTFAVLEAPKYVSDADKALQIISYVSTEYIYTQSSPNLVIDDRVIDRMNYRNSIEIIVREAVRDKTFEVYYQPILCVNDGKFKSAEALVRLKRPSSENYISPEDFIPVAEKCGLIQEIDDLVFEKVCSFIARENLQSYGVKTIEVNLSGNEVVDRHTFSRLIRKMEKYHIPPKFINFEITETAYINNDDVFKENVQKLKEIGSSFSMDDFGSGYSNLLELLKMDYVLVKMDKEFIWNCLDLTKPENMRMLEYSIGFLKDYGLHILAEGVETVEQAEILISKGVEYLQGFYYSRPIPENEYIEFLKAQKGEKQ
jgi:EAL domain-containing protein (putative c-di-GMP-specific phosphodiesterase class I)